MASSRMTALRRCSRTQSFRLTKPVRTSACCTRWSPNSRNSGRRPLRRGPLCCNSLMNWRYETKQLCFLCFCVILFRAVHPCVIWELGTRCPQVPSVPRYPVSPGTRCPQVPVPTVPTCSIISRINFPIRLFLFKFKHCPREHEARGMPKPKFIYSWAGGRLIRWWWTIDLKDWPDWTSTTEAGKEFQSLAR